MAQEFRRGGPVTTESVRPSGTRTSPERRTRLLGLSALLGRVLEPAARERGFARAAIFTDWPRIVGPGLAARCTPLRVDFPRGRGRHGTLVLGAGAAAALELQHLAPQILERINGFFGFPAVTRLRLRHVTLPLPPRPPAPPPPLAADARDRLERTVATVDRPGLRAALLDLGEAVLRRGPGAGAP